MLTVAQKLNLQAAFQSAHDCELETGCPASLTLAQWALESAWGNRSPGNNCFGIKQFVGCYGIQMLPTREVGNGQRVEKRLAFATFPTLTACFIKHAQLITEGKPYAAAWAAYKQHGDVPGLVHSVAKVYATDPAYSDKLLAILDMPEVQIVLAGVAA